MTILAVILGNWNAVQMPNFPEGHFSVPGQIRGLSVGVCFLKMKIIAPPSASS